MFGWMQLSCCFTYLRVLSKGDGWKGFANQCPQRKFSVRWFCALLQHTIYQDGNKQFIDNCQAVSKPYVILLEFTSDLLSQFVGWSAGSHGCRKVPTFYLTWILNVFKPCWLVHVVHWCNLWRVVLTPCFFLGLCLIGLVPKSWLLCVNI